MGMPPESRFVRILFAVIGALIVLTMVCFAS
jgi:uncharacterized membrane protein YeaQ/YmgE (transglycosylase-associated protein family)